MSEIENEREYDDFFRKVFETSSDRIFINLKEDEKLSPEDIEKAVAENEHKRCEAVKDCIHKAEIFVIWGFFGSMLILVLSYVWHLVTPWHYLSEPQLNDIATILSSTILASVLSTRFKKYF